MTKRRMIARLNIPRNADEMGRAVELLIRDAWPDASIGGSVGGNGDGTKIDVEVEGDNGAPHYVVVVAPEGSKITIE